MKPPLASLALTCALTVGCATLAGSPPSPPLAVPAIGAPKEFTLPPIKWRPGLVLTAQVHAFREKHPGGTDQDRYVIQLKGVDKTAKGAVRVQVLVDGNDLGSWLFDEAGNLQDTIAAKPEFAPWIVSATAGYAFQEFNWSVPFAAYDIEANPPRRLAVGHLENNVAGGLVDGKYWPLVNGTYPAGITNVAAGGPREWFFIFDVNYSTTQDPALAKDILNNTVAMMWMGTVSRRSAAPNFAQGNTFTIIAAHINTVNNTFAWTAPAPTVGDQALAANDVEMVNVYPNPYVGYNPQEVNKYERFVTFTHLPTNATLRVFNLAGVLVRTLKKEGGGQFFEWDLQNEDGFPVAAGMYIVYIDMPDQGKTKILKLGVIPEQQFIDKW